MHTCIIRAEDIINRGGATLAVELFGSVDEDETPTHLLVSDYGTWLT